MSKFSDLQHVATNVYYDRVHDIDAVKILPGEYYVTDKDMLIVTVLGSCVAAWKTENIPIVAQDLLGTHPRKVYQFAKTGKVRVKKLTDVRNDTIFERERTYRAQLVETETAGDVELFG